jgi:hypothetical protein
VFGEGATCTSRVSLGSSGLTIEPGTNVTLLGAFAFAGGSWFKRCPNGDGDIVFTTGDKCTDPCT